MNTIHSLDSAVLAMVERAGMFLSSNVPNLVCYQFKPFDGSVSIKVDGRFIEAITVRISVEGSELEEYHFATAKFRNKNDRPFFTDRDWMRDMFKAVNAIARRDVSLWEDMGTGFGKVELDQIPLKFD